jgi:hypothetical protein
METNNTTDQSVGIFRSIMPLNVTTTWADGNLGYLKQYGPNLVLLEL